MLHVAHPRGSALIVGSAGYVEGALKGLRADVVFLGTGGLGTQTEEYRQAYWRGNRRYRQAQDRDPLSTGTA